ncbi:hypothetical protein MMC31_001127 [Peltigera leucophlebia]|nr:hypothetical protein [Peltigera leucophlebia]
MIIDGVKVLYFPEKSPVACFNIPGGPTTIGPKISDDLRKRMIPVVLSPIAALLPTTTSASLKSASDRDLTPSISASPADFGSPSLPANTNEPYVKTSKPGPTASSRQTSSTSGHDSATGHVEPSTVHSEHQPSRKPSTNLGHSSQPPLNEPGQEPSSFLPVNRGQQEQGSPKGSGEQPAQGSPVDPNNERVQVSSESQEHEQQTDRIKLEHQGSSGLNLGQASHLVLSTNHVVPHFPETPITMPGTVLSSLTSKALVIASATIIPSKSISSQPSSFFAAITKTTAAAGSSPFFFFDTRTLNSARKAEANTLSGTSGSLRFMRVMHTSTMKDVDLPTTNTSTSTSISHNITMTGLRGLQSKTHVPRELMIFGGYIIFAIAYISF